MYLYFIHRQLSFFLSKNGITADSIFISMFVLISIIYYKLINKKLVHVKLQILQAIRVQDKCLSLSVDKKCQWKNLEMRKSTLFQFQQKLFKQPRPKPKLVTINTISFQLMIPTMVVMGLNIFNAKKLEHYFLRCLVVLSTMSARPGKRENAMRDREKQDARKRY